MMQPSERIEVIRERLEKYFQPTQLDVIDDSHKHQGHVGSRDGAGHYTVVIQAEAFKNKTRIDAHREIYGVLSDLIPREVHALEVKIVSG